MSQKVKIRLTTGRVIELNDIGLDVTIEQLIERISNEEFLDI